MAIPNALDRTGLQRGLGGGSFAEQLVRFADKVEARQKAIFEGVVATMRESVVHGSSLTGAPGQPVRTGRLRDSWLVRYESPNVALIYTTAPYARAIEHNWKPIRRSLKTSYREQLKKAAIERFGSLESVEARRAVRLTKSKLKVLRTHLGLGLRFRSGGSHSVKLTRVAFRRVVERVARQVGAT